MKKKFLVSEKSIIKPFYIHKLIFNKKGMSIKEINSIYFKSDE